jgi:DNA-binding beta-propeller fold protein YncE
MEPSILETAREGRPPFSGMREPRDLAVDGRGRLWIADFGNSRLRIFDASGGYLGGWGNRGNEQFALSEPASIAIRGDDVYIADTWNGRIQSFTTGGTWKASAGGLFGPRGVAVAPDGRVWVSDTGNHRIIVYDAELKQLLAIGKLGPGAEDLSSPVGIAAAPSGTVYVADVGNRRIQAFEASGRLARSLPVPAWTGPAEPFLEVGPGEEIYVTDPDGGAVLELDRKGAVRRTFRVDAEGKAFARPTGLALAAAGSVLYVVNTATNTISRIRLDGKPS